MGYFFSKTENVTYNIQNPNQSGNRAGAGPSMQAQVIPVTVDKSDINLLYSGAFRKFIIPRAEVQRGQRIDISS